jgi:K+-sensing histidine kinase KdpD
MGIAADKIDNIFSDKESDQSGNNWDGCGLGLPTCQQLASAINARIYYNSIHNEHTSFILVMK